MLSQMSRPWAIVVRGCLAGVASAWLTGCAAHYVAHTGGRGRAFVARGDDLLHCEVVSRVPSCWTVVSQGLPPGAQP